MFLKSIASAIPPTAYSQKECWDLMQSIGTLEGLRGRSRDLLEKVLTGESGIKKRHFAVEPITTVFGRGAQELNQDFEVLAPVLAGQALTRALAGASLQASDLDALFVCTCTGYLCPGLTSHLAEKVGLRADAYLQDLVGLGCGAAIPALRSAAGFLAAHPKATVAVVPVEICSAAFYIDDDPGVLISLCLFGDGASASLWQGQGEGWRASHFDTLHVPKEREKIRFVNAEGKLKNKLHRSVPSLAGQAVATLFQRRPSSAPPKPTVIAHSGGRDVIESLDSVFQGSQPLRATRQVLSDYGNMSSPSVLFALEDYLSTSPAEDSLWLTSFGAGFACHSVSLNRA
ncbi:MAG: stilbene synthase [Verrucomicrobiota bacterium]